MCALVVWFLFDIMSSPEPVTEIPGALIAVLRATVEPRFQAVMHELVMTTLHDVIDEALRTILALHGRPLSHVCDARCRALTAGTVLTVSCVQALLAPQGVLPRGALLVGTRPKGGALRTPKLLHGTMCFVGARGAGDFVLGIPARGIFLFDPMCLYSKYSEFRGEFKNG